jgi:long-chain fatty acid transport protein
MSSKTRYAIAAGGISFLAASAADASSFYLQEQSVTGLGRAFAGQAAMGTDVTALSFNPAAITRLPSAEVSLGGSLVVPRSDPDDAGSSFAGVPFLGSDGDNPYDPVVVPAFQAAYPFLDNRLWIGLAVTAPFGLQTEYDDDWTGRYDSTRSELTTYNIQPSVAYRVTPWLSIGGGIDIQYADAELRTAIPNPLALGPFSPAADGDLKIEGDDWSVGFNIGILVTPRDDTRIGLHYRSAVEHELKGDAELRFPGVSVATAGSADLDLPDIASLAVAHDVNERLTLAGSINWYRWSNFEEIRVRLDQPLIGATEILDEQDYRNSFGFALGAEYRLNERWTFRGGFQYDQTPVRDAFRDTRVPDEDRYWLTVGASYQLSDRLWVDAAYGHIFVRSAEVDQLAISDPRIRTRVDYDSSIDLLALGLRYRF